MSGWWNKLMAGFSGADNASARNALFPPDDPSQIWRSDNPVGTETVQSLGMPQPTVYAGLAGQYVNPATGQLTEQGQARMADNPLLGFDTGGIGAMAGGVRSGLSLQRVNPRNLNPMSGDPDLAVPGNHAWFVRNPAGDHIGTVDTEWDPMMGELHIADLQSNEGANSLGPAAVKQLRDALLEQYPEAKTLSGYRITGSNPNREIFQRVQRDQGRDTSGLLDVPPPEPPPPSLTAYHGSPAAFDRFANEFIGTGEGNQAYGYGHYLADSEGVARSYRDALTPQTIPNPEFHALHTEYNVADAAAREANMTGTEAQYQAAVAARDAARAKLAAVQAVIPNPAGPQGHMYEVNVAAEPEHFLDWDKPLSEQHPVVKDALSGLGVPDASYMTGQMAHDWLARTAVVEQNASRANAPITAAQRLNEAGIPGIRYLDRGSRAAGEGTKNTVVFSPEIMNVIRRYGIAGLMTGAGASAALPSRSQNSGDAP